MKKFLISAAAAAIMTGAAYAQTEFYVVQDTSTKICTIVDKKPTTTTTVVVGDGKVFRRAPKFGLASVCSMGVDDGESDNAPLRRSLVAQTEGLPKLWCAS